MDINNLEKFRAKIASGGLCVGPFDPACPMGYVGNLGSPEVDKVVGEIIARARKARICAGTASGPCSKWKNRGVGRIALASDCGSMMAGSVRILKEARS